jgi:mannitol/fructose-specific phosphotransferase system IIA component (Ntr-type)
MCADNTVLTLADYTDPGLMVPNLRGLDAPAVIQELSVALQREGRITDLLPFYQAALNREYLCSTVTQPGCALPHALVKGLCKPSFALGRTHEPIVWVGNPVVRVQLVFLVAAPETDAHCYMTLILGLARLGKDSQLLGRLLTAKDSFEMVALLRHVGLPVMRTSGRREGSRDT